MATIKLRYVQAYTDRHGKRRHYLRRPGSPRLTLPGEPGSPEFLAAYAAGMQTAAKRQIGSPPRRGSVAALITSYVTSPEFSALAEATQRKRRQLLEHLKADHGEAAYVRLTADNVRTTVFARPGIEARRNVRKAILALYTFAIDRGWADENPALKVKTPRKKSDGYTPWTEADVDAYRAHWPSGTRERMALELLIGTGQRRQDVIRMGRQHVSGGRMKVRQLKTGRALLLPIPAALALEIELAAGRMTLLETEKGGPFAVASFGNWFRIRCKAAGVEMRAHGLRKLAASRLAEAGCSASEIAAVTGHKTLSEVQRYTESADQVRLAEAAMAKLEGPKAERKLSNPKPRVSNRTRKP